MHYEKTSLEEMRSIIRKDFEKDEQCELIGFLIPENDIDTELYFKDYFQKNRDVTFYLDANGEFQFIYTDIQYQLILESNEARKKHEEYWENK